MGKRLTLVLITTCAALGVLLPGSPARADPAGSTWDRQPWTGMLMSDVAYGEPNGQPTYVSVSPFAGPARVWSSLDGISWEPRTTTLDAQGWQEVAYGNGRFVAVINGGNAATSLDGVTWTTTSIGPNVTFPSVSFVNGIFMALGNAVVNGSSTRPMVATSVDGTTWTARNILDAGTSYWQAPAYGNGRYVTVAHSTFGASRNRSASSTDGITWTQSPSVDDNQNWQAVEFFKGRFVAVGNNSSLMTSVDGQTWTAGTLPVSGKSMSTLASNDDTIIAVGNGVIFTSQDGISWTSASAPSNVTWSAATSGPGGFLAWGRQGTAAVLYTSGIGPTSGPSFSDSATWRSILQAVPAGVDGRCDAIDDQAVAYGTGIRGGWSPSWQEWSGSACVRTLVNRGNGWTVE